MQAHELALHGCGCVADVVAVGGHGFGKFHVGFSHGAACGVFELPETFEFVDGSCPACGNLVANVGREVVLVNHAKARAVEVVNVVVGTVLVGYDNFGVYYNLCAFGLQKYLVDGVEDGHHLEVGGNGGRSIFAYISHGSEGEVFGFVHYDFTCVFVGRLVGGVAVEGVVDFSTFGSTFDSNLVTGLHIASVGGDDGTRYFGSVAGLFVFNFNFSDRRVALGDICLESYFFSITGPYAAFIFFNIG